MVITTFMLNLSTDIVEFAFGAAILFMAIFSLLAPWWKSEIGWARISLDFGIALALSPVILNRLFGISFETSIAGYWYQLGAVAFVGCISLWNAWIVFKRQALYRQRKNNNNGSQYQAEPQRQINEKSESSWEEPITV
jgi:hypothetical protein